MSILGMSASAGWGELADYAGTSVRFYGGGTHGGAEKMLDAIGRSYPNLPSATPPRVTPPPVEKNPRHDLL